MLWGYDDIMNNFLDLLGVISIHFRAFQGTVFENVFGVAKFQIFLGMPDIPYIFLGKRVDAGYKPRYLEKMKVSPMGSGTLTT